MNKPYSDEQLKLDTIEEELRGTEPQNVAEYAHRLAELVDTQADYYKYESVAELRIDDTTHAAQLVKFGEMLQTMTGPLRIKADYSLLKAERERDIKDRVADICTSERYRRQEENRKWEVQQAELNQPVAQVVK
jgi:hypothetical protein